MRTLLTFLALGASLATAATTQAAPIGITNLVTNGDFSTTTSTVAAGSKAQISGTSSIASGWSSSSQNGYNLTFLDTPGSATSTSGGYAVYPGFPSADTNGTGGNFVQADGDPSYSGTVYQSISGLIIGQMYTLSFDYAGSEQNNFTSPSGYTTEWWNVSLDTSVLTSAPTGYGTAQAGVQKTALLTTPNGSYSGWRSATMTFTASATTEFLSFLAGGTPTGAPPTVFLDNVVMQVPEPATLSVLGTGVVALMVARRRRRAAAVA